MYYKIYNTNTIQNVFVQIHLFCIKEMLGLKRMKEVILQIYGNLNSKKGVCSRRCLTHQVHLQSHLRENHYYGIESEY